MRNIKELLQLVRDNIIQYWGIEGNDGLCLVVWDMYLRTGIIIRSEEQLLERFIKKTQPFPKEFENDKDREGYGWEPGELQPRLEYLDKYLNYSLEELEEILNN